jgi:hypothetical protein
VRGLSFFLVQFPNQFCFHLYCRGSAPPLRAKPAETSCSTLRIRLLQVTGSQRPLYGQSPQRLPAQRFASACFKLLGLSAPSTGKARRDFLLNASHPLASSYWVSALPRSGRDRLAGYLHPASFPCQYHKPAGGIPAQRFASACLVSLTFPRTISESILLSSHSAAGCLRGPAPRAGRRGACREAHPRSPSSGLPGP